MGVGRPSQAPRLLQVLIWGTPSVPQQVYTAPGWGQTLPELPWVLSPPCATGGREER